MVNFERSLSSYQSGSDDELHATCESKQGCSKCAIEEGCGWCGDGADGLCQLTEASCKFQFIEAHDDCPAVGANVSGVAVCVGTKRPVEEVGKNIARRLYNIRCIYRHTCFLSRTKESNISIKDRCGRLLDSLHLWC